MSTDLYNVKSARDGAYRLTKFDKDYTIEGSYLLKPGKNGAFNCECAAGHKPTCRHREMLPIFIKFEHINDGWFLIWQTRKWASPVGDTLAKVNMQLDELTASSSKAIESTTDELTTIEPQQIEDRNILHQAPNQEVDETLPPGAPEVAAKLDQAERPPAGSAEEVSSLPPTSGNLSRTKDGLRRI
jgi:hypothetical protein